MATRKRTVRTIGRWLAALALSGALLAEVEGASETKSRWFAVFLQGKKVGYEQDTRTVGGGKVETRQAMHIEMKRGDTPWTLETFSDCEETADGKPLAFRTGTSESGGASSRVEGVLTGDGSIKLVATSAGRNRASTAEWPEGALLAEGARLLAHSKGIQAGTTYRFRAFAPELLRDLECEVAVGATADIDILGRKMPLTEVNQTLRGEGVTIRIQSWVDKDLEEKKLRTSMMGMDLELVHCPRALALSPNASISFSDYFVASPRKLTPAERAGVVQYTLDFKQGQSGIAVPETDEQKRLPPGATNQVVLWVERVPMPQGVAMPYAGKNPAALAALRSSAHVQSDAPELVALAREAVGDAKDGALAAQRIEAFVRRYIRRKDLSVGYGTALEVAKNREGDCSEHAVLAAALCQASGIPARVAFGVAYSDAFAGKSNVFIPHAWTQAYLDGKWISLDASLGAFDAGHVTLGVGSGEPEGMVTLINTFGCFSISRITCP
jgi:hypothetical protein